MIVKTALPEACESSHEPKLSGADWPGASAGIVKSAGPVRLRFCGVIGTPFRWIDQWQASEVAPALTLLLMAWKWIRKKWTKGPWRCGPSPLKMRFGRVALFPVKLHDCAEVGTFTSAWKSFFVGCVVWMVVCGSSVIV